MADSEPVAAAEPVAASPEAEVEAEGEGEDGVYDEEPMDGEDDG